MAWEGSNRRAELPPDWYTKVRPRILGRDGERCQWPTETGLCLAPANQVDHKNDPHDHSDDNLWALCAHHHGRKTAGEGNAARTRQGRVSSLRPRERHPGLKGGG